MVIRIGYSEALMKKFGNLVISEQTKRLRLRNYYYKLHSKDTNKNSVNDWLTEQIGNKEFIELALSNTPLIEWQKWGEVAPDYVMHQILKWVHNNIKYKSDMSTYGQLEYWATGKETLLKGFGDCDDHAILIILLGVLAGVQKESLFLQWGPVYNPTSPNLMGHAYIIYFRQYDGLDVVLDSTYYYNSWIIKLRQWFGLEKKYSKTIWGYAYVK